MPSSTYAVVSSADWKLGSGKVDDVLVTEVLGHPYAELEDRCRNAVEQFVVGTYDESVGAARHYYSARDQRMDEFDSGNFLIALNFLTMYDRYGDEEMLNRAESCYRWAYDNCTETHPMFTWQGGVRDGFAPHELYVKYTADAFITALALHARRPSADFEHHIVQYHSFLKRARRAGFKFTFNRQTYAWTDVGFSWNGFGGPVLAYLQAHETLGDSGFLDEALLWGRYGLDRQGGDGGYYLLDGEFWNSDLTALELRALVHLHEVTGEADYLNAARRYADWLVKHQRDDGAWPIGIDLDGEVCAPNVGPGDMPNIAMSLVRLHMAHPEQVYLDAAVGAVRFAIGTQLASPGQRYWDDPRARWGFWSWVPAYDWTLSGDQVVHHVRGIMMLADYLGRSERR